MQNDVKDIKDKKKSNRKKEAGSTKVLHYKHIIYVAFYSLFFWF